MTKNYSLVQSLLNIYEHFMEKKDQLQYLPVNQNSKNKKRLDRDGFHRLERKTNDIDLTKEKRRGEGPIYRGKTKYYPAMPKSDIGHDY